MARFPSPDRWNASGFGFCSRGGYIHGLGDQYFQWQANGRYSSKGYKTADAQIVYPTPQEKRRFEIKGSVVYQDYSSLRFFGIGNDTTRDNRSTYLLNDRSTYVSRLRQLSYRERGRQVPSRFHRMQLWRTGSETRCIKPNFAFSV